MHYVKRCPTSTNYSSRMDSVTWEYQDTSHRTLWDHGSQQVYRTSIDLKWCTHQIQMKSCTLNSELIHCFVLFCFFFAVFWGGFSTENEKQQACHYQFTVERNVEESVFLEEDSTSGTKEAPLPPYNYYACLTQPSWEAFAVHSVCSITYRLSGGPLGFLAGSLQTGGFEGGKEDKLICNWRDHTLKAAG